MNTRADSPAVVGGFLCNVCITRTCSRDLIGIWLWRGVLRPLEHRKESQEEPGTEVCHRQRVDLRAHSVISHSGTAPLCSEVDRWAVKGKEQCSDLTSEVFPWPIGPIQAVLPCQLPPKRVPTQHCLPCPPTVTQHTEAAGAAPSKPWLPECKVAPRKARASGFQSFRVSGLLESGCMND